MRSGTPAVLERTQRRRVGVEVLGIGLLLALVVPIGTFAGKGGGGNTVQAWIGLSGVSDGSGLVAASGADPSLGDWVTFHTVVPRNVNNPRIEVLCYQGGELTFGMAGAIDYEFLLGGGGSTWRTNGGEADCVANLYYFSWKANTPTATRLATTSFHAGG